ncbi:hypothetical protein ABK040_005594 [Willaertia magna]
MNPLITVNHWGEDNNEDSLSPIQQSPTTIPTNTKKLSSNESERKGDDNFTNKNDSKHKEEEEEEKTAILKDFNETKQKIYSLFKNCSTTTTAVKQPSRDISLQSTFLLPKEYNSIIKKCIALVFDLEKTEKEILNILKIENLSYLCNVLIHEIYEILHILHDIIEDRVIRGEFLLNIEIKLINKLNKYYFILLEDLLPKIEYLENLNNNNLNNNFNKNDINGNLNMVDKVLILEEEKFNKKGNTNKEKNNEWKRKVKLFINDFFSNKNINGSEYNFLKMSKEYFNTFKERHIQMTDEKILSCFLILFIEKCEKFENNFDKNFEKIKLRYLFITNYRILITSINNNIIKKKLNFFELNLKNLYFNKKLKNLFYELILFTMNGKYFKIINLQQLSITNSNNLSDKNDKIDNNITINSNNNNNILYEELFKAIEQYKNNPISLFQLNISSLFEQVPSSSSSSLLNISIDNTINDNNNTIIDNNNELNELNNNEIIKIEVTIRKADKLRPSIKKQKDNPIFFIGIGNPEHFINQQVITSNSNNNYTKNGNYRINRFKSKSILKNTRSPEFNETFILNINSLNELLLDIRLYSKQKNHNDFIYGIVNIPLKEILLSFYGNHHLNNKNNTKNSNNTYFDEIIKDFDNEEDLTNKEDSPKNRKSKDKKENKLEWKGKWEIWCGLNKECENGIKTFGNLYATIKGIDLPTVPPNWLIHHQNNTQNNTLQQSIYSNCDNNNLNIVPPICTYNTFILYEEIPYIYGRNSHNNNNSIFDIVGLFLQHSKNSNIHSIIDMPTKRKIYTLEKFSFLKKEYIIRDTLGNVFAKAFHKMKTFRKRKIRLFLGNGEHLYTMEGGCFNDKKEDNEVFILNSLNYPIASVVFGEKVKCNVMRGNGSVNNSVVVGCCCCDFVNSSSEMLTAITTPPTTTIGKDSNYNNNNETIMESKEKNGGSVSSVISASNASKEEEEGNNTSFTINGLDNVSVNNNNNNNSGSENKEDNGIMTTSNNNNGAGAGGTCNNNSGSGGLLREEMMMIASSEEKSKMLIVNILDPLVDRPLLLIFCYYVLYTQ